MQSYFYPKHHIPHPFLLFHSTRLLSHATSLIDLFSAVSFLAKCRLDISFYSRKKKRFCVNTINALTPRPLRVLHSHHDALHDDSYCSYYGDSLYVSLSLNSHCLKPKYFTHMGHNMLRFRIAMLTPARITTHLKRTHDLRSSWPPQNTRTLIVKTISSTKCVCHLYVS